MHKLEIKPEDKILIIAPHPDDESIGTGGLLCTYPTQCTVIVATDGRKADQDVEPDDMATIRSEELYNAMSISGIKKYRELGFKDGELCDNEGCFSTIDFSKYSKVFLPHHNEMHPDHVSVFAFAVNEIKKQQANGISIYQYETRKSFDSADCYLDITDKIDKKVAMIYSYKSQIKLFDHASFAKAINNYVASKRGYGHSYFEAYTSYDKGNGDDNKLDVVATSLARYRNENEILKVWLEFKVSGNKISSKLKERGWNSAAIYGYGKLGQLLSNDLKSDLYEVAYALDKRASDIDTGTIEVYKPDKKYSKVDVIIIATLSDEERIREKLRSIGYKNIISLKNLLDNQ